MFTMQVVKNIVTSCMEIAVLVVKIIYALLSGALLSIIPKKKKSLEKKLILITGAGHGLGKALAEKCAQLHAYVILWDINEKSVSELETDLCSKGYNAKAYYCDITDEAMVKSTAARVYDEVGSVDILINNAGIFHNVAMEDLPMSEIKRVFEVNVISQFQTIRSFLPRMMANNHGHLVSIASAVGLIGVPFQSHYSASKFAVIGMMESISEEIRGKGKNIHCTVVCPSIIDTGMMKDPHSKYPSLLPILTIDKAVNETIDAIRKEKTIVTIPKFFYPFFHFKRLLPDKVTYLIYDFLDYFKMFTPKISPSNGAAGTINNKVN